MLCPIHRGETLKIFVQSNDKRILSEAYGTVYNLGLHSGAPTPPFFLVHGGLQGNLRPDAEIIDFVKRYKPELFAAPDIYRDQERTFGIVMRFADKCPAHLLENAVAIYQGEMSRYEDIEQYKKRGYRWLGIPSDNEIAVDLIPTFADDFKIHVLGGRKLFSNIINKIDSIDIVIDDYDQFMMIKRWAQFLLG